MKSGKAHNGGHFYEFGAFRLDPSERIFARNGQRIPLAPKAFDTLLILVQHSGRVLTKEELISTLWPDSFVEENNLTQHISALRRVLAVDSQEQGYIETVPKLGYRFLCDVREIADPAMLPDEGEVIISKRTRTRIVLREELEETDDEEGTEASDAQAAVAIQPDAVREISTSTIRRPIDGWKKRTFAVAALVLASSL